MSQTTPYMVTIVYCLSKLYWQWHSFFRRPTELKDGLKSNYVFFLTSIKGIVGSVENRSTFILYRRYNWIKTNWLETWLPSDSESCFHSENSILPTDRYLYKIMFLLSTGINMKTTIKKKWYIFKTIEKITRIPSYLWYLVRVCHYWRQRIELCLNIYAVNLHRIFSISETR